MKIIKQQIATKTKTLTAKWTIAPIKDIVSTHGIDLENELGKQLQHEIDQEIVNDIIRMECMKKGWVKAPFTTDKFSWPFAYRINEVTEWIHTNATGEYQVFGKEFWFQKKVDLTAFILKWS
jgi:Major capsid protein Gp23